MTDISKKWACTHYRHHTFPHPRPLHKYTAYAYKYVNRGVWACVYCVSYIHIYIYASGAGLSEGGMLTFLVLLPLHVATLHRCLAVLHLCMHCRNGPQCWKVDTWVASACVRRSWGVLTFLIVPCTSSATCCYAAQMSGSAASLYTLLKRPRSACVDTWLEKSVATLEQSMPHGMLSKTSSPTRCVQRSQIFSSYVKGWQWRYVSLHAHLQQKRNPRWSACSEKKERKNLPTCSNDMNPKPTRNANFARDNLVHFGLQKCLFRFGENVIF